MTDSALRAGEMLLADLQPGAYVLIGPNAKNEAKGVMPSDRIFEVKAVNAYSVILADTTITDSAASNRTILFWKDQVRFYNADDLIRQIRNENTKPPASTRQRERELSLQFTDMRPYSGFLRNLRRP